MPQKLHKAIPDVVDINEDAWNKMLQMYDITNAQKYDTDQLRDHITEQLAKFNIILHSDTYLQQLSDLMERGVNLRTTNGQKERFMDTLRTHAHNIRRQCMPFHANTWDHMLVSDSTNFIEAASKYYRPSVTAKITQIMEVIPKMPAFNLKFELYDLHMLCMPEFYYCTEITYYEFIRHVRSDRDLGKIWEMVLFFSAGLSVTQILSAYTNYDVHIPKYVLKGDHMTIASGQRNSKQGCIPGFVTEQGQGEPFSRKRKAAANTISEFVKEYLPLDADSIVVSLKTDPLRKYRDSKRDEYMSFIDYCDNTYVYINVFISYMIPKESNRWEMKGYEKDELILIATTGQKKDRRFFLPSHETLSTLGAMFQCDAEYPEYAAYLHDTFI